jgi:hypothetical protein
MVVLVWCGNIILWMEESVGSEKFTFGEVQDTEYICYDVANTELALPYNPFLFDLQLALIKVKPNHEPVGTIFPLSR